MSKQTNPNLEETILELIADHDGAWGWSQLDRALSARGIVGVHVPTVVDGLSMAGFLTIEGNPVLAISRYRITAEGRARLSERGGRKT